MSFNSTALPYYSEFIHLSRYSRWRDDLGRRETWEETIERWTNFWIGKFPDLTGEIIDAASAIYSLDVMPSMRTMLTAGPALDRDNMAGYNCSYIAIEGTGPELSIITDEMREAGFEEPIKLQIKNPIVFDELMYVLLCGTGVGFSVERQYIANLPTVGKPLNRSTYRRSDKNYPGVPSHELSTFNKRTGTIRVADSKYGWASALRILITELYNGNFNVKWDTSEVRPAGAKLKTFGGRASGPEPINDLFSYCVDLFRGADGRKLTSIETHGLVCKIASVVVVGGVRRSALISLSNLSDERMRHAKSGEWWNTNPEFALANNSSCHTEKPNAETFIREWKALIESKSGERGIFNRVAARLIAGRNGRRDTNYEFGTNPCSEIILRSRQVCNLSEVVVRQRDTLEDLKRKVRLATFIGTLQATLTNFRYLSPEWRKNTEEEALLGVSMTGIMDHPILSGRMDWDIEDNFYRLELWLKDLREEAIETNKYFSERLGIRPAAAITAVKPSGTVSQLVDSASGIHPRYSQYYIRTVRNDIKDPVSKAMVDMGIPYEVDVTNPSNYVFSFPIKAPEGCVTRNEMSAIEQLELWKIYQNHWCEHKPSITVYVEDKEWMKVGAWVYENFDIVSGVSFLPKSDHTYRQAPYQEITSDEYYKWLVKMPEFVDWSLLAEYESEDNTTGLQEYACSSGNCEL